MPGHGRSLYDELGVSPSATPEELKQAYRRLARETHPDVNPGDPAAEERFKRIGHAFEILADHARRALYDELGDEAERLGFDPERVAAHRAHREAARGRGAERRGRAAPGRGGKGGAGADLDDLLAELLGRPGAGGAGWAGRSGASPGRGEDVRARITVPFEDAARGGERRVELEREETCPSCAGLGARSGPAPCRGCGGSGWVPAASGSLAVPGPCPVCGGTGRAPGPACPTCAGKGVVRRRSSLDVRLPAGVDEGQQIRLRGQGAPGGLRGPAGDLLLEVHLEPHPVFRRDGLDLVVEVPVTVREALFGAEVRVPTLAGEVNLRVPPGTQPGSRLRLRGLGIARKDAVGDLLAVVVLRLPDASLDPEAARRAADALEALYPAPVRPRR